MFGWFRKQGDTGRRPQSHQPVKDAATPPQTVAPPAPPPATPSSPQEKPVRGKLFLRGPRGDSTEEFDLVQSAAAALRRHGHAVTCHPKWLVHDASGLIIQPQLDGLQLQDNRMLTVTTIDARHPTIKAPRVFEYQHSAGEQLAKTLDKGFDLWAQGDLPALLDALIPSPKSCTMMVLETAAKGNVPARKRRAILGPVAHLQVQQSAPQDEHPFCPCCFFTRTGRVFQHVMNADGFFAIRFYGMRDEHGVAGADCRVNGEEFEEGKAAIREYVATWPGTGFEFRRQYVIWQDMPADSKCVTELT
jgi:hypothetical protein